MTIEVENLAHSFGELRALDGVSFRAAAGEVFGLLGPNGAGKSTTVRALLGVLRPDSGTVRVAGIDVATDGVGARARIGYLPEVHSLYEALTPREHLSFVGRLRGLDDATIDRRGGAFLSAFEIEDRADEPIRTFSKGMRQKVALALAFIHQPKVLLLDEPLSGLDATAALLLKELVKGVAKAGTTVLYCSHVLDVVEKVCDRALILARGKPVAQGTIAELRERTRGTTLDEVFRSVATDVDPIARARELLEALAS